MENMHFDKVSGDAYRPPDYPNQPKNYQKGPGLNTGTLVTTVEEDMVGFQDHHSPHYLESSGALEVPGIISDDGPGNTSRKPAMFSIL